MLSLVVQKRPASGKAKSILAKGSVPAVVYGAHQESTPIVVDARAFEKIFKEAGEATIVSLEGVGSTALPTLIHEVDLDPLTNRPRHIDFYAVTKGQKVEVEIPLTFVGEAPAIKAGHNLIKVLHELPIKADPMNLPHDIEVDVSTLANVGDQVHVRDLKLPSGVELMISEDEVVILVQEVKEEVEEVAPAADLSAIEVEKKGKEDEEAAAGEAPAAPAAPEKEKK